jgi:hypothetical protein
MRPLQRFKVKDGELVVCKQHIQTEDGNLLLVNEVLLMFNEELRSVEQSLFNLTSKDRDKMDEYDKKREYALEAKKSMIEEFIRKVNQ